MKPEAGKVGLGTEWQLGYVELLEFIKTRQGGAQRWSVYAHSAFCLLEFSVLCPLFSLFRNKRNFIASEILRGRVNF